LGPFILLVVVVVVPSVVVSLCISVVVTVLIVVIYMLLLIVSSTASSIMLWSLFLPHAFELSSTHLLNEVVHMSGVVRLFSEDICTCCDLLKERVPLLSLACLNALLDDIVAIPVLHHLVEWAIHCL
jgi:energy-coupling factor transporter transmembrane protein EcfT